MKLRNIFFTLLLIHTLVSCSTDSESITETQQTNSIVVKKIIKTYGTNEVDILTYKYDGNKIVSETWDGGLITYYTYTGDVITKIETKGADNITKSSFDYIYLNGKVVKEIEKNNWETDSRTFTYNANGTVSYARTRTSGESTTGLLTFENGNLVKNEEFYGGQYPSTSTYIFGYDTKNNPFKNVLGFNLLFDTNEDMYSKNNMTQDGSGGGNTKDYYTFKYDANGYPTERTGDNPYFPETYQYFY